MACGTGKTLTAYWINKLFNGRVVVFVPSLYLLSQFYSDWVNQSCAENVNVKYLLVGSDVDGVYQMRKQNCWNHFRIGIGKNPMQLLYLTKNVIKL